ncbi:hypothetical protein G7046_g1970 [Stylonectria norvegica]|nr:hypothetical protein G7046_g1970 [Stylonectria norvegica]
MSLTNDPNIDVEALQRQLEQSRAQTAHLEKVIQRRVFRGHQFQGPQVLHSLNFDSSTQNVAGDFCNAELLFLDHRDAVAPARSSALSRSKTTAPSTEQQIDPQLHAHKRQRRAFSQQSAPTQPMSRSMSARSETNMPFVQSGHVMPLANPTTARFYPPHEDATNLSLQGNPSPRLSIVQENSPGPDIGMNPGDFIANWNNETYIASTRPNLSPNDAYNYHSSSGCPSMISGSSAAETTSPLTRQNSSFDNFSTDMARLASSQSQRTDSFFGQEYLYAPATIYPNGKRPASEALFGISANLPPPASDQYASVSPNRNQFLSSPASATMERSGSNTSACSAKSSASRSKEALERVLQNGKSAIAPKPQNGASKTTSHALGKKEAKLPVKKSSYQRPKHPKVLCNQCGEHPEGFRGDHELRRHVSAKHEGLVKKYVCRDPAEVGIIATVQTINPLSKCKACVNGKQYGAYYNAAAHLRRTHFKPKTARNKSKNGLEEKRGGKGGGDWPPMNDLKFWFTEKIVKMDQPGALGPDKDDTDADGVETKDLDAPIDMFSGIGSNMGSFDLDGSYDMSIQGADPASMLVGTPNMSISVPVSSASGAFGFSPYSDGSSMHGLSPEYTYANPATSAFGSNMSSSNTITPTTYQDMSQLSVMDPLWNLEI